jgi:hypothetical protein
MVIPLGRGSKIAKLKAQERSFSALESEKNPRYRKFDHFGPD